MIEDPERCYRAVCSRDARFDGWLYTAVTTTGIYCRPSCPATTPKRNHIRFFPSAAAAQLAGFRACKRCRPDATPGSPEWDGRGDVTARAVRLIADGVVDREGVVGLGARLGYSVRQLERLLLAEVGAGPLALARAQRAQAARVLVETTSLPLAEVAFAAGFSSIRQFNDTVRTVFATTPTGLRTAAAARAGSRSGSSRTGPPTPEGTARRASLSLRLPFRAPLVPGGLFGHLAATAVPGCEEVRDGRMRRTLRLPHGSGIAALAPTDDHVACTMRLTDWRDLGTAIARIRRLLDLDADPVAVAELLQGDEALAPLVRRAPGRRIPRCVDESEMALRVVLGQQVSTAAAARLAAGVVQAYGEPVDDPEGGLTHLFPSTGRLAEADPATLPTSRRTTVVALARALESGELDLGPGADRARARAALGAVPGLGPWSVELIAMRAMGDPDAFPATDLGVRRGAVRLGLPRTPAALGGRARAWRPWRAYAVQYVWSVLDHAVNRLPAAMTGGTHEELGELEEEAC